MVYLIVKGDRMKSNRMDWLRDLGNQAPTFGRPNEVPMEKALDLRQRDEIWECTVRRARVWITPPDRDPFRPHVVITVSRDGRVLGTDVLEADPTPPLIIQALMKAMCYPAPGSGGRRRPTVIYFDDAVLTKVLAPELEKLAIRCTFRHSLPKAEQALQALERPLGSERTIPALLETPGVTPRMGQRLFEAAAFFYRQAPWRWIDDANPIEIRYPVDSQTRYAVVMGQGGETYGLAIYNSTDVLRETYAGTPPDQLIGREAWTALLFGLAVETPFDDLDAIEVHDWPIAAKDAYPLPLKIGLSAEPTRPGPPDLLRMEAALLAIPRFVREHMIGGGRHPRPAEEMLEIKMTTGEAQVHLRYPVPGFELVFEDESTALAEMVAVRDRNAELLHAFAQWLRSQDLPAATIRTHLDNIDRFAERYMAAEGGSLRIPCPADEAAPVDIDEFLADWLPYQGDRPLVGIVKSSIASLKTFYTFLRETDQMPAVDNDEILRLLQEHRGYYIELAREFEAGS